MHVDSAGFLPNAGPGWIEGRYYTFSSPLEPGTDGNCVAMIYIRDQQPWWKIYPCGYTISGYWICKKQPKTSNVIQGRSYPSLTCKSRSLVIQEVCYEYKVIKILKNDGVGCPVEELYLSYLNQIVAYHGIEITFIVRCSAKKTYKSKMQAEFAVSNDVPKSWIIKGWKFQMQEEEPHYSMCSPTMQQCLDKSCRAQSAICQLDFKCAPKICACKIGNQMEYSMQYCRYVCPPRNLYVCIAHVPVLGRWLHPILTCVWQRIRLCRYLRRVLYPKYLISFWKNIALELLLVIFECFQENHPSFALILCVYLVNALMFNLWMILYQIVLMQKTNLIWCQ